jgi:hypothetical protein
LGLLGVAGCGPKLYPVRGRVTYKTDGKPLTQGMVVFQSEDNRITARGEIGRDGEYELGTYERGDGALPGKYRVLVAPKSDPNAVDKKPPKPPPIDPRFSDFMKSGLQCEVKPQDNNYPIEVARPGEVRR